MGQFGSVIESGLVRILREARGVKVLGAGLDHAALERAVARRGAQVVILDEDGAATPAIPKGLRTLQSNIGLVALAHRPTRAHVTRILAYGVSVCLSTAASPQEIVRGVRLAAGGGAGGGNGNGNGGGGGGVFVATSADPAAGAARAVGMRSLTRREQDVLGLLSTGHRVAEIAHALQISIETARTHTQHVYRKLNVSSRGELLGIER